MLRNKMLYGLFALFVGFAMSFNTVNAQVTGEQDIQSQNNIVGQVVDAQTGEALSDVTVEIEGMNEEVTTNRYGVFTLENLDLNQGQTGQTQTEGGMGEAEANPGEISFTINHEGYQEFSKTLRMDEITQLSQQGQQQVQGEDPLKFELEPEQGDDF